MVALPRLVPDDEVGALVSVHHALRGIALPVGAALGGLLFQRVDDHAPFVLDAATFLMLIAVGFRLRPWAQPRAAVPVRRGVLRTILPLDGLSALRQHRLLAMVAAFALPFVIALESVNAVEVFLVKDILGGTSGQYGLSEAVAGVAAVIGALAVSLVHFADRRARAVIGAFAVISAVQVVQGLAPTVAVYIALAGAVGLLLGSANALVMTLMVTATDPDSRGRIVALVGGAARSSGVLALALGGALGAALGPRTTFVTVGVVGLGIAAVALHSLRRVPVEPEPVTQAVG